MSSLQEGAGLVVNHQSTNTLPWPSDGEWARISSHFEGGTRRYQHRSSHFTTITASVTVSGVSGAAAVRENRAIKLNTVHGRPHFAAVLY